MRVRIRDGPAAGNRLVWQRSNIGASWAIQFGAEFDAPLVRAEDRFPLAGLMNYPEQEFPAEFKAFLYSCIDSVEQVEILALLCRSGQAWNARTVGTELGLADTSARHHLETLAARGLLQTTIAHEVTYSYGPKSADLRRYGDQLAEYYVTSRTALLKFIATSPRRVKRFADAFKLRDAE